MSEKVEKARAEILRYVPNHYFEGAFKASRRHDALVREEALEEAKRIVKNLAPYLTPTEAVNATDDQLLIDSGNRGMRSRVLDALDRALKEKP